MTTVMSGRTEVELFQQTFESLREQIGQVIVGQREIIEGVLIAFVADGHVLLEGVPGLGKTLLVRTFSQALGLTFKRIQCTPDLMPADILGTQLVVEEGGHKRFEFSPGPVFTHVLLADEINRATPKTQAALLEAMEERQVTVAGQTHRLPQPFFVLATQNPIEMEGTFNLPEAQLDRFLFKLHVGYPEVEELKRILQQTTVVELPHARPIFPLERATEHIARLRQAVRNVLVASPVEDYVTRLVMATHPNGAPAPTMSGPAEQYVHYGASPRGAQAILLGAKARALLEGRVNVSFDDVERMVEPALNHRLVLNFEAEAARVTAREIVRQLQSHVHRPA